MASNTLGGLGALVVGLLFSFWMIRNIISVRKLKREKEENKNDN